MTVTFDLMNELVRDAQKAREQAEKDLSVAELRVADLRESVRALQLEEQSFRSAMSRRFPKAEDESALTLLDDPASDDETADIDRVVEPTPGPNISDASLQYMPKTEATAFAMRELDRQGQRVVSPSDVQLFLNERGRNETREDVSSAIAYWKRKGRVTRIARGQWSWLSD